MWMRACPTLASSFCHTNASWTLKCDLDLRAAVCRVLNHLARIGLRQPRRALPDPTIEYQPWLDFSSGYVQRAMARFPKQGTKAPWKLHQNYALDLVSLRYARLADGTLEFSNPKVKATVAA